MASAVELRDTVEQLSIRKEELKQQLLDKEAELDEVKETYRYGITLVKLQTSHDSKLTPQLIIIYSMSLFERVYAITQLLRNMLKIKFILQSLK